MLSHMVSPTFHLHCHCSVVFTCRALNPFCGCVWSVTSKAAAKPTSSSADTSFPYFLLLINVSCFLSTIQRNFLIPFSSMDLHTNDKWSQIRLVFHLYTGLPILSKPTSLPLAYILTSSANQNTLLRTPSLLHHCLGRYHGFCGPFLSVSHQYFRNFEAPLRFRYVFHHTIRYHIKFHTISLFFSTDLYFGLQALPDFIAGRIIGLL